MSIWHLPSAFIVRARLHVPSRIMLVNSLCSERKFICWAAKTRVHTHTHTRVHMHTHTHSHTQISTRALLKLWSGNQHHWHQLLEIQILLQILRIRICFSTSIPDNTYVHSIKVLEVLRYLVQYVVLFNFPRLVTVTLYWSLGLSDLTNKNTRLSVKFEFQDKQWLLFLVWVCPVFYLATLLIHMPLSLQLRKWTKRKMNIMAERNTCTTVLTW